MLQNMHLLKHHFFLFFILQKCLLSDFDKIFRIYSNKRLPFWEKTIFLKILKIFVFFIVSLLGANLLPI